MPTISMFRGIKITMYWADHMPPHFHATYGGSSLWGFTILLFVFLRIDAAREK